MKTVHSQVLSSAPISLSDATSFLSAYNASVCGHAFVGASPATCLFVRRALASFQELEQLHHKLHDRNPTTTSEAHDDDDDDKTTVADNPSQSFAASRDVTSKPKSSHLHDDVISLRVEVVEQSVGGQIEEIDNKERKKKKKKKKKRDNVDENGGEIEFGGSEEKKKMKKRSKSEVLESGEVDASEEQQEKKRKKRKSEVLESSKVDASEEQQEKKKKRRKS